MARRPSLRTRIRALTDTWEPNLQRAFLESIEDIKSNADLQRIVDALDRGDVAAAIRALNLDTAAFRYLDRSIADAFDAGGASTAAAITSAAASQGAPFVFRWDLRNTRAENILAQHAGQRIREITDDIRLAVRQHLTAGLEAGQNPRVTALNLIGRYDAAAGRRTGGIIGLTSTQEGWVRRAREDLLSGSPARLTHYLGLNRRDRRFDSTVRAAMKDGRPIGSAQVTRMISRLSDSYLQMRGEAIARTETIRALNASNREAFEQAFETGNVRRENVTKVWFATQDQRTRDTHIEMHEQEVPFDQPFQSSSGAQMMYPGDGSLGAPAEEIIQCRCTHTQRIDFSAGVE